MSISNFYCYSYPRRLLALLRTLSCNRPCPHSTSLRTNNSTRARLGWTFSYIYCIFVHPDLDLALLFVGMRERSTRQPFSTELDIRATKYHRRSCPFPKQSMPISRHFEKSLNYQRIFLYEIKEKRKFVSNYPESNPKPLFPNIPLLPLH